MSESPQKKLFDQKKSHKDEQNGEAIKSVISVITCIHQGNMFTENINSRVLSMSKSLKNLQNPQQAKSLDLTDLQFEICSNFMRLTKQKLYHQEAELISLNEALINKVNEKAVFNSSTNMKDMSASQDTTNISFQGQDEDDIFSQSCKSMLILRRSKSSTCMRRTETDFSSVMREIQHKCSQRTLQTISTLIEQNKRLKERNSNIDKKEKQFRKKQVEYEKEQEQTFVLKKKAAEYDKIINSMHAEIAALKLRLKENQSTLKRSKSPTHDLHFPQILEIQTSTKLLLNQKQKIIAESTKNLQQLYLEVQKKIEEPFSQKESCEKCCQMLKKVKGSILKYRQLMEVEANAVEDLYEKFKAKLK